MAHLGNDRWEAVDRARRPRACTSSSSRRGPTGSPPGPRHRGQGGGRRAGRRRAGGGPARAEGRRRRARSRPTSPRAGPFPLWVDRERALFSAWYELFPRSEGGFSGRPRAACPTVAAMGFDVVYLPPIHPIGRSHRKGPQQHPRRRAERPRQPVGHRHRAAATPRSSPSLGTIEDFDALRGRGRAARPGGRPRLRAAVLARPPVGHRASRVVPPPARRHHQVRREPAQEVPGHLPDQLLAGRRRATARRCGRRARRSSTTGSATASASSGSTTPTPSRWRSGSGSSPRCRRPPRDAVPRRGVHPAEGDGQAGRGRLQPELHVLHVAQHPRGARRVPGAS